jgi:hypothetical protein
MDDIEKRARQIAHGRRLAAAAFVFFATMFNLSAAFAQNRGDQLIVPGERVGSIQLGIFEDQVLSLLGQPTSSTTFPGHQYVNEFAYGYRALNMSIIIGFDGSPADRVTAISVSQYSKQTVTYGSAVWSDFMPVVSKFHTAEGITIGSSSFDVARKFGSNYVTNGMFMVYCQRGIQFLPTTDDRVFLFGIFAPSAKVAGC